MSETEKQEGQKTVVAFIAGLLIGGLLVWVFSSSPEAPKKEDTGSATSTTSITTETKTTEVSQPATTNTTSLGTETTRSEEVTTTVTRPTVAADRDGNVTVGDQSAGSVVTLTTMTTPADAGWIVVRDYENGAAGRILGAARFNEAEGLTPASVNLLRATEAGKNYQVVFFGDNGDKVFDLDDDAEITGISGTFSAQ